MSDRLRHEHDRLRSSSVDRAGNLCGSGGAAAVRHRRRSAAHFAMDGSCRTRSPRCRCWCRGVRQPRARRTQWRVSCALGAGAWSQPRVIALPARAVVTADANSSLPELVRCARSGASSETGAVSAWDGGFRRRRSVQPQIGAVSLIDGRGEGRQPARGPRQVVIVRIRLAPAARRRSTPERFLSVGWQVDRGV